MGRRQFIATVVSRLAASAWPIAAALAEGTDLARIIVGFAPGGTGDFLARTVGKELRARHLASTVVVENRPGAGGLLALRALKAAKPDGSTLLITPASVLTMQNGAADPLRELTPIGTVSDLDFAVVAGSALPARSIGEWMTLARRDPRYAVFGSAGVGTIAHLLGLMLARGAALELAHAPYKGGAPTLQDAIGGQLPVAILTLGTTLLRAHHDGRVRVLATSGAKRSLFLPDVMTLQQSGLAGIVLSDWSAIVAPAGMPAGFVDRLSRMVQAVVTEASFADAIAQFCLEPLSLGHRDAALRLLAEHAAMAGLVKRERIVFTS